MGWFVHVANTNGREPYVTWWRCAPGGGASRGLFTSPHWWIFRRIRVNGVCIPERMWWFIGGNLPKEHGARLHFLSSRHGVDAFSPR